MESGAMGIDIMGSQCMKSARRHTKGFTLIASLLMLLLLSGIAIGLMMMVNTEGKVGGTDLQNNVAYHAAEGGIEKMYSDLSTVFQTSQAPTPSQICGVGSAANEPAMAGVTWITYTVTPGSAPSSTCPTSLTHNWGQISSGPNQGLWAQIIPVNMLVTADLTTGGQEVSMLRTAQVALIPVFQFGVFSESDLAFFPGAAMDFAGPVHTNGDLYPFGQATVTFHSQLSAWGNVVRTLLPNGNNATNAGYTSNIYVPTANSTTACSTTTTDCVEMDLPTASSYGDGSVQGAGGQPPASTYNGQNAWYNFSETVTHREVVNGNYGNTTVNQTGTGASHLSMPFVDGTKHPYEIIRRPPAGENPASAISQSREYNLAQIHVLLSDDPADLPGGASDTNNVRLANVTQAMVTANSAWTKSNPYGISIATANTTLGAPSSGSYSMYFAAASNAFPDTTNCAGTYCPSASAKASPLSSDWPYFPKQWTPPASQALDSNCTLLCPSSATTSAPLSPLSSTTNGPLTTIVPCPPYKVAAASLPSGCPSTSAPVFPYYTVTNAAGTSGTAVTSNATALAAGTTSWNLIDGWLRVEYLNNSSQWVAVTNEWLGLGFARGTKPPTASGGGTPAGGVQNPINPNAILLLQEPADRNGDGVVDSVGLAPTCTSTTGCSTWNNALLPEVQPDTTTNSPYFGLSNATTQSISMYNWYPINFYDVREGENRDNIRADDTCTTNGVMNAVEIDVGNLKRWLSGAIGTSGTNVNYLNQNGYVLYFSDRRGMLFNPNPPMGGSAVKTGDSGLEDVINSASAAGTPDGALESPVANSPEDDNQNGFLDNYGALNMGLGFYNGATNLNTAINTPAIPDPFGTATGSARITSCMLTARKNWVSGARHVLRLVDGSLGNVPLRTDSAATLDSPGGFTVASENPVYILGDYNSNAADAANWANDTTAFQNDQTGHAAASVITDALTLLSNNWTDLESMTTNDVTNSGNRNANTVTSYRLAIASGKNRTFPFSTTATWATDPADTGTDGGVHNFLHFLENWNVAANYKGSMVSLYYSTYNTGFYKCCNTVYQPPTRNYFFDLDFTSPGGLPPGTPMFRDVESLGYRQIFTTRLANQ